jgi:hypothetical protein
MRQRLSILIVVAAAALSVASARADKSAANRIVLSPPRLVKADSGKEVAPEPGDASLRLRGNSAAVQLDVQRITITEVLSALASSYHVSFRTSVTLDHLVDGAYTGTLGDVIMSILSGYDFVIMQNGQRLDVLIVGKSGEKAVASPMAVVIRQHRVPTTTRISRNR